MKINSVKIISLLFFVLSVFYLYTAHQIQVFAFDEGAPFNAKTFPIYLTFIEYIFLKNFKKKRLHIDIEGEEILEEISNNDKPVIFVSGHFANFELMSMEITRKKSI